MITEEMISEEVVWEEWMQFPQHDQHPNNCATISDLSSLALTGAKVTVHHFGMAGESKLLYLASV